MKKLNEEKEKEEKDNNVVAYIRVSTTEQTKGFSLKSQQQKIENYCKDNNLNLVHIYIDTTSGLNPDRESINELLNDAEDNKFKYVIAIMRDRISRDPQFYGFIQYTLKNLNIEIRFTDEKDTKTEEDEMFDDMMAVFAKFETKRRMKRIRDNKQYAGLNGHTLYKAPFGYLNVKHNVIIDPEKDNIVLEVFALRKAGWSYRKIQKELGFNNHITVRNILLNENYYRGMVKYNGKWIKGIHEPILRN